MGSGCIDLHFFGLGTSWRWVVTFTPLPLYPRERATGTPGGWVDPRAGLDDMEKWKFFTLSGLELPLSLVVQPVTSRYTDWAIPFSFFFNLCIVGGGAQTGFTRHRGHLLSYCAYPGWLWGWIIIRWNEDWQGKPKYSEKTCPSATFSTTNPTWRDPGSNPGRRGGKPATNRLSYGAAIPFSY
jgi:hypothetical protein